MKFDFGRGPVPAHQHANGGGWVANTAEVSDSAYVGPDARVYGSARVCGDAEVYGAARVYGIAQVCGGAEVYGSARVYGDAQVCGDAEVYEDAQVYGSAWVYGSAQVCGDAQVYDRHHVVALTNIAEWGDITGFMCSDGLVRVVCGCRSFTIEEAKKYWKGKPNRIRTYQAVLFIEKLFKLT